MVKSEATHELYTIKVLVFYNVSALAQHFNKFHMYGVYRTYIVM